MKKFLFPTGGQPTNLSDFKELHDELIAVLEAQFTPVGACALTGLVVSGAAGSANISAGWVYLDGEYCQLPAQTGVNFTANPTQYIKKGAAAGSRSKNFVIGGAKNTRETKNAELTTTLPVAVDFITIKFTGHNYSYAEVLGRKLNPVGTVLMVATLTDFNTTTGLGSGVWKGWALCDSQNGTVNLKGRFVVGWDGTDSDYDAIGDNGGAKTVTLSTAQIPAHSHVLAKSGNVGNNPLTGTEYLAATFDQGGGNAFNATLGGSNSAPDIGKTADFGGGTAHENRPPYYTLAYVQKIAP